MIGNVSNFKMYRKIFSIGFMTNKKLHQALFEIGKENVRHMENLMMGVKTGHIYKIKGNLHQASAPGEAPAILTGEVVRSLYYEVRGHKELEFGAKAKHAGWLEKGTKNMDPRPFVERTAHDRQGEAIDSIIKYANVSFGVK